VIYLDSSVALAHLLAEDRFPAEDLWRQEWNRIHSMDFSDRSASLVGSRSPSGPCGKDDDAVREHGI
jgi:hypothetical protein